MEGRQDPVQLLPRVLPEIYQLAADNAPWGRVTIGDLVTEPGSRNTVPEHIRVSVDIRHPEQAVLDAMHDRLQEIARDAGSDTVRVTLDEIWHSPAIRFHDAVTDAVRSGVDATGLPAMEMVSGAGHDSVYVSRVAPTGMIFIPCRDGLSHNEAEYATPEDIGAGCNVLLNAVLSLDAS